MVEKKSWNLDPQNTSLGTILEHTLAKFFKNMNFQLFFTRKANSMCIYFAGDVASRNPTFVSEHPSILHGNDFLDIVQQHLFLDLNWGLEIPPSRAHTIPTRCPNLFRASCLYLLLPSGGRGEHPALLRKERGREVQLPTPLRDMRHSDRQVAKNL